LPPKILSLERSLAHVTQRNRGFVDRNVDEETSQGGVYAEPPFLSISDRRKCRGTAVSSKKRKKVEICKGTPQPCILPKRKGEEDGGDNNCGNSVKKIPNQSRARS